MNGRTLNNFDFVYRSYKTSIYNYILKMTGNNTASEDITHTVFLKFFENLNSIRNLETPQFWLFRTARNEIYKFYKNKKIHVDQYRAADTDGLEVEGPANVEIEYDEKELLELINKELDSIPAVQKEVYILKEYSGLNYQEISEVTGIEENVLRKRFFDARNKLIDRLSNIYLKRR